MASSAAAFHSVTTSAGTLPTAASARNTPARHRAPIDRHGLLPNGGCVSAAACRNITFLLSIVNRRCAEPLPMPLNPELHVQVHAQRRVGETQQLLHLLAFRTRELAASPGDRPLDGHIDLGELEPVGDQR